VPAQPNPERFQRGVIAGLAFIIISGRRGRRGHSHPHAQAGRVRVHLNDFIHFGGQGDTAQGGCQGAQGRVV
jgi:hypothetical protein